MTQAILNGKPCEQTSELLDLALYGFACFTSFFVSDRTVKGLNHHLERLHRDAMNLFGIAAPRQDILENLSTFVAAMNDQPNMGVRITLFPAEFSLARPGDSSRLNILVTGRSISQSVTGPLRLAVVEAVRPCPGQKTVNMIDSLRARALAQRQNTDDALMCADGLITEGPTWNVFFGKGSMLTTPALDGRILPGVTRTLLIDSATVAGFEVLEQPLAVEAIGDYDYAFASNAMIGVKPVAAIDAVGFDAQSDYLARLSSCYASIKGEAL